MNKIRTAFVGIGGYAAVYLRWYRIFCAEEPIEIAGVIDPMAEKSPAYGWVMEKGIPVYTTLAEFYAVDSADFVVVCTPTLLHQQQSIEALRHGSHVLCEKPLVPLLQDLPPLRRTVEETGRQLAVGFQWSFAPSMLRLKKDILQGRFGRPLRMRTFVSWPRPASYYQGSTWKGRIKNDRGEFILDSIVTNATAHYLHNIFFLLGGAMEQSRTPQWVKAELYRAKKIETFDTCFLRGGFDNGCEFLYMASHSTEVNEAPRFCYEFENAVVSYNLGEQDGHVWVEFSDGKRENYGDPLSEREEFEKFSAMMAFVRTGKPLTCTLETVVPHLTVCNAIFELDAVTDIPQEFLQTREEDGGDRLTYVKNLYQDMRTCFDTFSMPSHTGMPWAGAAVPLMLDGYERFSGHALGK